LRATLKRGPRRECPEICMGFVNGGICAASPGSPSLTRQKRKIQSMPLARRRAASARPMCLGVPSPRHILSAAARKAGQEHRALSCAAGAQRRAGSPVLHGRGEHGEHLPLDAPEHRGIRLGWPGSGIVRSPCLCRSDSVDPVPDVGSLGSQRTEGSPPWHAKRRVAILYSVGPIPGPDQEAVIRFSGKAPRRRARSGGRHRGRLSGRVATTSDRHR
jgi:hypothetical protein